VSAVEERRRPIRCPACPYGYLHTAGTDPTCDFALVDLAQFGPSVAFGHCHSCGAVMPDDYAITGRYDGPLMGETS
jgi:hypothetical protein